MHQSRPYLECAGHHHPRGRPQRPALIKTFLCSAAGRFVNTRGRSTPALHYKAAENRWPLGAAESQRVASLGRRSLFIQPSIRQPYRPLYLHETLQAEQHADRKIPK
ncbi:unnamed protein product [Boreogadus saida]